MRSGFIAAGTLGNQVLAVLLPVVPRVGVAGDDRDPGVGLLGDVLVL